MSSLELLALLDDHAAVGFVTAAAVLMALYVFQGRSERQRIRDDANELEAHNALIPSGPGLRMVPQLQQVAIRPTPGRELRLNGGLAWRIHTNPEQKLRTDLSLELQYLKLGRDVVDGVGEQATGGRMLYAVPGVRLYWDKFSFAVGVKKALWKNLNEQSQQQGAEGLEKYRLLISASMLF